MFSIPKTPAYFVYLLFVSILIALGLFGGYRASKAKTERWAKGKSDPWLSIGLVSFLFMPFLLQGFLILYFQNTAIKRYKTDQIFHGREVRRQHPGQKLILCLGGSSTEGSPFDPDWPYDYPQQLERTFAELQLDVAVANAGIIATTSSFSLEHMPEVLDVLKPDVVTLNYMYNDSSATFTEVISQLLQKIGLARFGEEYVSHRHHHIRDLVRLVQSHGARSVFVLEPHFEYIYFGKDPLQKLRRLIRKIACEEGAFLVDPNPVFRKEKDRPLFIDENVHLTRFGTELLAEILAFHIRDLLDKTNSLTP